MTNLNFRLTPNEQRIVISYEDKLDNTVVLMPNYNAVYQYAEMNGYLSWIENDLKDGEFVSTYHSITFQELLDDDTLSEEMFLDYIKKKTKKNIRLQIG